MVRTTNLLAIAGACALSLVSTAEALDVKLFGLNYNSRIGADWESDDKRCKSPEQIKLDMALLANVTGIVRLYSLTDCNQGSLVIPAAINAGLNVSVGLWVGKDAAAFQAEKAKLQELINAKIITNDRVFDIHVGSEALFRKDVTVATSIDYMKQVKAICANTTAAKIPITVADVADVFITYPELIDAVDMVSANAFPFWEKWPIDTAGTHFLERMTPLFDLAKSKGKEVFIGETGWASDGSSSHASPATPANALRFFTDFYAMASQNSWKYFYFSAFDEDWKIAKGSAAELDTVEAHFGLFNANRMLKDTFKTLTFTKSAPAFESQPTNVGNSASAGTGNGGASTENTSNGNTGNGNAATSSGNAASGTAVEGNAATGTSTSTSSSTTTSTSTSATTSNASAPAKCTS